MAAPAEDPERVGEVGLGEVDELVPRYGVITRRVERSVRIPATLTVLLALVGRATVHGQDGLPLGRPAVSEDGIEFGDDVAEAVVACAGEGRCGARHSELRPCPGHGRERRAPVGRAAPDAARARQPTPQPCDDGALDATADERDHGAGPVSALFLAGFQRGEPRPVSRARID